MGSIKGKGNSDMCKMCRFRSSYTPSVLRGHLHNAETNDSVNSAGLSQGCHGQGKKCGKLIFFPDQGKVREVWFELGKLAKIGKKFVKTELHFQKLINLQNCLHCFVK